MLTQISQATGGRAEFLSSAERLPEVAAEISRELRNQYILGYRPTDLKQDGKLHRIIVKVRDGFARPLQVYYKRQYLAER